MEGEGYSDERCTRGRGAVYKPLPLVHLFLGQMDAVESALKKTYPCEKPSPLRGSSCISAKRLLTLSAFFVIVRLRLRTPITAQQARHMLFHGYSYSVAACLFDLSGEIAGQENNAAHGDLGLGLALLEACGQWPGGEH